jgi:hypothetical protein
VIRIVSNAAVTFMAASPGFTVASVAVHHTTGFQPWAGGLAITGLGNFLLAVLLVGRGVVRLIASWRGAQP